MDTKSLKPYEHYSERYDRHTVDECRWWVKHLPTLEDLKERVKKEGQELEEKELIRASLTFNHLHMYLFTGERYVKKEETIREWMRRDEESDRFFDSVTEPTIEVACRTCGRLMFVSSRHNEPGFEERPDKVLFFYDCPSGHLPRRLFYHNGEEYQRRDRPKCPKCHSEVNEEDQDTDEKFITVTTCPNCDYTDTVEIERTTKKEENDPDFEAARAKYCLDKKRGEEFAESKRNMESFSALMKEIEERKKNKEKYEAVAKLKKLRIMELEELLTPVTSEAGYVRFQLKDPEMGKQVVVPFVVYDKKAEREEYDSKKSLEKLIRASLADTNWRLTIDGVSYRLGMLEGRLRAYEKEEDLLKLVNAQ